MKNKIPKPLTVIFILIAGMFLSLFLYYLVDNVFNGSFVDWFTDHYISVRDVYDPDTGSYAVRTEPAWGKLKSLMLNLLLFAVALLVLTAAVSSVVYAKMQIKKTVTEISRLIRQFMVMETDAYEVFPKEYAEISVQMTELKSAMQRNEQILKEETARKNDLITYLAHDLKTPLTSVIGYLSLLDEAFDMPCPQRTKYTSIALDKAHRLELLINEFFEITRYNLQQISLEKEMIDLNYMLVQMTDEFYPLLTAHGNTASFHADEPIHFYGDPDKLARVFHNILKNAIAYSYPDTAIDIYAKQNPSGLIIRFCNKGKTIPEQKLNSIFEKFFRLDEARTTNTGGAGLGLAIAKEIVALHGGTILAKSENEQTTFQIEFPIL